MIVRQRAAAGLAALTLLAGCGTSAAVPPRHGNSRPSRDAQTGVTSMQAQAATGALPALPVPASHRSAVPWQRVGGSWALALYSASTGGLGRPFRPGPATIYLVAPSGDRYAIASVPPAKITSPWTLEAWSAPARQALLSGPTGYYRLQLNTGRLSRISLPGKNLQVLSYTRPDGLNILVLHQPSGQHANGTLERFNLAGKLQRVIATGFDYDSAAYDSAGSVLAVGGQRGIELASNAGGIIRRLPVPGRQGSCTVVRWWTANVVLAECFKPGSPYARLWLVPDSGATPSPLTPQRGTRSSFDFGDFSAWQLSSGLYLNGFGACGSLVIGRQPGYGREQQVTVPGSGDNRIITATRSRLLVQRIVSCEPHNSLVWYNPATRAMTVALPARQHEFGVAEALPGFIQGKTG